jgi:integrase
MSWVGRIAAEKPATGNILHGLLRRLYSWAVAERLLEVNPLAATRRPAPVGRRELVLSLAACRAIWSACEGLPAGDVARLVLLTGVRRMEALTARWDAMRLDPEADALWSLPGHARKTGDPLTLPLVPAAVRLLAARRRGARGEFVFQGRLRGAATRLDDRLLPVLRRRSGVSGWSLHDLRRTVASHLAGEGVPRDVVESILGHSRPGIVATYQRWAPLKAMRAALEWWAGQLLGGD